MDKFESIIHDIYTNKKIYNICKKYYSGSNLDDISQDITIMIMEQDKDKIISLYENNELDYYIMKIAKNQIISASSYIYRKYRKYDNNKVNIGDYSTDTLNTKYNEKTI